MIKQRIGLLAELLVQFIWTAFLIILLLPRPDGQFAALFISPAYFWLLYISITIFLLFMFVTLYKLFSEDPGHTEKNAFIYLLIPILFFPIAKNTSLGSAAVNRKNVESILSEKTATQETKHATNAENNQTEAIESPANPFPVTRDIDGGYKNTDGTTRISDILLNDEAFLNSDVEISGKAEFNELLPDGSFYLYRFIIFCCAADAAPSGLIIYGMDNKPVIKDHWYRVKGRVSLFNVEGKDYMAIEAKNIEEQKEPSNPYEYLATIFGP